jgi:phospholipase/lecithinase/hemolysin
LPTYVTYFSVLFVPWRTHASLLIRTLAVHRTPVVVLTYSKANQTRELTAEKAFNSQLTAQLKLFQTSHGGAPYLVDTASVFNAALDDPAAFGAPDATCTVDDDPSCLWANTLHPATVIHKQLAKEIASDHPSFWEV